MTTWETRPTTIYWLIDMRPETIAAGWAQGRPFYCGKTVHTPEHRLVGHRRSARCNPDKPISKRINDCTSHIRILVVDVVQPGDHWVSRERYWIRVLREKYPETLNIRDGGEGTTEIKPIILTPKEQIQWQKTQGERERLRRSKKRIDMRTKREGMIAARQSERKARLSANRS